MSERFELQDEFMTGNNITHITINDKDVLWIQLPEPEEGADRKKVQQDATRFFHYLFEDFDVKIAVEFIPLNLTVLTKKEEFVARLGDKIVEL